MHYFAASHVRYYLPEINILKGVLNSIRIDDNTYLVEILKIRFYEREFGVGQCHTHNWTHAHQHIHTLDQLDHLHILLH